MNRIADLLSAYKTIIVVTVSMSDEDDAIEYKIVEVLEDGVLVHDAAIPDAEPFILPYSACVSIAKGA